jgi:acetamidase/formamidase/creatinine amidohydrolase/Fe(II)-dependent formamide hydrolase-like protein
MTEPTSVLRACLLSVLLVVPVAGETHHFKPTTGVSTFAVRPPVLTLAPGDVLESESLWGEWYDKPGGKWPGEVGPIAIAGAEPGDTLVVEVLKVRPNRATAVSTQGGHFGALVPDYGTAMLNDSFPRERYVWRLDLTRMTGTVDLPGSVTKSMTLPLSPMLGRVAVAPDGDDAFGGLWPGPFGGNMDVSDVREGTTVYLPVFHEGALFYFGDGHALMGDGEVCGSGLETSMDVAFRFSLLKKKEIAWPRLEDAEHLMVAGSARPLTDAARIAFAELVGWLVADYGFAKADAYQLVSQTAVVRLANVVDPLYTVVAKFPKRFLPSRTAGQEPGVRLGTIAWTDAEPVLTRDRIVMLPLGAGSKEHGPHLTLGNDAIEAEYLARRVVDARPVALLPALTYGFYPAFLEFPGSVSVSEATQRDIVVQIVRSIARYGPRRFYVLNTGVSTARPLSAAAEQLAREGVVLHFTDITQAWHEQASAQGCTHADEVETSMVLYMAPSAVRMERAAPTKSVPHPGPLTRDPSRRDAQYAPSGGCGDPSRATWQAGQTVTEAIVANVLAEIDALAAAPLPAGAPGSPLEPGETR